MAKGRKTGGRAKGTPNVATRDVREAIRRVAEDTAPMVEQWLSEIDDPAKRLDLFLRMIEYHIPKLARTEVSGEGGGPLQIVQKIYADRDSE